MKGSDQRIVQALEKFNLPIYYAEIPANELDNMHYFYYRETGLSRSGTGHFIQSYEVAYVSLFQEDLMEEDIIDALESKGFKFQEASYARVRLESTNNIVDVVVFSFNRPLRRNRCM